MATATFRHGKPTMVDHTPGSKVNAGDVVVINDTPFIAHTDIAANVLGALAMRGGVYELPKASGSGTAINGGVQVYWDANNSQATTSSSGNKLIGRTTPAGAADDDTTVMVEHDPQS